jgi:hypothetical protein
MYPCITERACDFQVFYYCYDSALSCHVKWNLVGKANNQLWSSIISLLLNTAGSSLCELCCNFQCVNFYEFISISNFQWLDHLVYLFCRSNLQKTAFSHVNDVHPACWSVLLSKLARNDFCCYCYVCISVFILYFFSLVHRLTVKLLFARVQRCKALWCGFELLCGITFGLCVDFFHGQCLLRYTPWSTLDAAFIWFDQWRDVMLCSHV